MSSASLWRECAQWLIRCEILDRNHRVTWPNADLLDFAQILRDGVILCQLANRLLRGCVDMREVNLRPQLSQFLCLKNICVFLRVCQTAFELPQTDLFEAWQLYKVADFGKVLHTLSKLSTAPVALRSNIKGFPEEAGGSGGATPHHEYYNDEIFRSLAEEAESKELDEEVYNQASDEEYGKIYDVIVTRPHPHTLAGVLRRASKEWVPRDRREHCIKELLETERNYVDALNMMLGKFCAPLKDVLSPDDHAIIFINLHELAQIHTGFQSELNKAARQFMTLNPQTPTVNSQQQPRMGDVFVRWKPKFVVYSEYCSKMTHAQARVDYLCAENSSVKQKIIECQSDANENRFRLQDLLSVPMQRVLKYHLLLKELVRATDPQHDERPSLDAALEAMLDLSLYVNEVKRDCEILQLIKDVQSSIVDLTMPDNTDLTDYGRLLKDGELRLCSHEDRKIKNRYVFIFDKVLMICKNIRGSQYTYKNAIVLGEYDMVESEALNDSNAKPPFTIIKGQAKWSQSWSLEHKAGQNVYQMYCKSKELKDGWKNAIQMAHDNVFPRSAQESDHCFQYFSFPEATVCSQCYKLLRGLVYQGYKCQQCGMMVHKECIGGCAPCGTKPRPKSAPTRPMSFNQHVPAAPPDSGNPVGQKLRVAKAFNGNNGGPDFLTFHENDIVAVLATETGNPGWWKGRVVEGTNAGRVGLFPADNVRRQKNPNRTQTWHGEPTLGENPDSPSTPSPLTPRTPTLGGGVNTPRPRGVSQAPAGVLTPLQLLTPPSGYVNLDDMEHCQWYCGALERDVAEWYLKGLTDGSFLVRYSEKQGRYAISISYMGEVKHVKVEQGPEGYWLDEGPPPFPSIVELVRYYELHNMQESFQALNTTLKVPLKSAVVGCAVAMHNFEPTATNMVSLHKGDHVVVLSKNGDDRGWWKGKVNGQVGYFPLAYVWEVDGPSKTTANGSLVHSPVTGPD